MDSPINIFLIITIVLFTWIAWLILLGVVHEGAQRRLLSLAKLLNRFWEELIRWTKKAKKNLPDGRTSLIVAAVIVGTLFGPQYFPKQNKFGKWLESFRNDAISLALGVFAIDWLGQIRTRSEYKRSIIQQLASRSNDFALEALRIITEEGWLTDGSLKEVNLQHANLVDAEFVGAVMTQANLQHAKLDNANFTEARLRKANMQFAIMHDVKLWKAEMIEADFGNAQLTRADFAQTDISGAKLRFAILKSCLNIESAIKDDKTTLPNL